MQVQSCHVINSPSRWQLQHNCKSSRVIVHSQLLVGRSQQRRDRVCTFSSQHTGDYYGPRTSGTHPAAYTASPAFAVFKQLNGKNGMESALVFDSQTQRQLIEIPSNPDNSSESAKAKQRLDLRERKCGRLTNVLGDGSAQPGWAVRGSSASTNLASSPLTALQQLGIAVAAAECLDFKEILESVEFVERVRKRIRRGCILDLAAGHGLVGLLLAAVERKVVERVYIVDWKQPPSYADVRNTVTQLAPWVADRVTYVTNDLHTLTQRLTCGAETSILQESDTNGAVLEGHSDISDTNELATLVKQVQQRANGSDLAVAAVHACGQLTDLALQIATHYTAPVAVMPCCYTGTAKHAPLASRRALRVAMAADLDRCYRLQAAGCYSSIDFSAIPDSITPLNRIIIAHKEKDSNKPH